MKTTTYTADELIVATPDVPIPGMPPWADLRFTPRPGLGSERFGGCGLYGIAFDGRVVYVGMFLGSIESPWGGSLLDIRWARHLPSLTMRGSRLSSSAGRLARLLDELPPGPFRDGLAAADAAVLARDRGYLACGNRVRFAARNWEVLGGDPARFLSKFELGYVRLEPHDVERLSQADIREVVITAEARARTELRMCCNGESDFEHALASPPTSLAAVLQRLRAHLDESITGASMKRPAQDADDSQGAPESPATTGRSAAGLAADDESVESDLLFERIEEDLPEGWPTALLQRLRTQPPGRDLQVHPAATPPRGDVRVRALARKPARNVFTMAWQPRKARFFCRILLDAAVVSRCPGVQMLPPSTHDPLKTTFAFDGSADPEAAIAGLLGLIAAASIPAP